MVEVPKITYDMEIVIEKRFYPSFVALELMHIQ